MSPSTAGPQHLQVQNTTYCSSANWRTSIDSTVARWTFRNMAKRPCTVQWPMIWKLIITGFPSEKRTDVSLETKWLNLPTRDARLAVTATDSRDKPRIRQMTWWKKIEFNSGGRLNQSNEKYMYTLLSIVIWLYLHPPPKKIEQKLK